MGPLLLLLVAAAAAAYAYYLKTRHPKGFPPHPGFSLPVVGDFAMLVPNSGQAFKRMWKKYGDVYGFLMGSQRWGFFILSMSIRHCLIL